MARQAFARPPFCQPGRNRSFHFPSYDHFRIEFRTSIAPRTNRQIQSSIRFHLTSMIKWLFPKIIGGKNEREVNRIRPTVARINEIEGALQREPVDKLLQLTATWQ